MSLTTALLSIIIEAWPPSFSISSMVDITFSLASKPLFWEKFLEMVIMSENFIAFLSLTRRDWIFSIDFAAAALIDCFILSSARTSFVEILPKDLQ